MNTNTAGDLTPSDALSAQDAAAGPHAWLFHVFSSDAPGARLCQHGWPFNVRELEKCLSSAVVLARGGAIDAATLTAALMPAAMAPAPAGLDLATLAGAAPLVAAAAQRRPGRNERRQQLETAVIVHRGNISAVARAIGKARSQVQRWLHEYNIDPARYRDP